MGRAIALPDASSDTGSPVFTGGASAHAVLGDLDDDTYATYNAIEDMSTLSFDDYTTTIPADALIKSVAAYVRVRGSAKLRTKLNMSETGPPVLVAVNGTQVFVNSLAVIQFAGARIVSGEIDPDNASVEIQWFGGGGWLEVTTVFLECTYVEKPTLTIDAPTGTIDDTTNPTVSWTPTLDTDGGAQFLAEVKVFTDAQVADPGFDEDTTVPHSSTFFYNQDTSWRIEKALDDGDYRVYVKVHQFGIASDWEFEDFTVDVLRPGVPGFDITPEATAGRVLLEMADTAGETDTDGYHVQHKLADGSWEDTRTELGDGLISVDEDSYYDYEVPNGNIELRCRAYHEFPSGELSYSEWATDADSLEGEWWMKHPSHPQLNVEVRLRSLVGHSRSPRQTVVQPLGRPDAVAIGDTRGPQTGTVVIAASDEATRDAVMALATETSPILLQAKSGDGEPDRWVALGEETVARLVDGASFHERNITYEWTEVERPPGVLAYAGLYPDDTLYSDDELYPH